MNNNKGITLIALIITIIVLLILAGVTINMVLGDNGLFNKAKLSVSKYENAQEKENQTLNDMENYIDTLGNSRSGASTVTMKTVKSGTGTANVPIPNGFYYVGGDLDSGVVISDNPSDENKYATSIDVPNGIELVKEGNTITGINRILVGNQFVWIPCDDMTQYKKTSWGQGNVTNTCDGYWDSNTPTSERLLVKEYKGFYIGRYEAGISADITEFTESANQSSDIYNINGVPKCIAGVSPWNFIDWTKSKENAERMYEENSSVRSGLITGTQWDITINIIANKGYNLDDSKAWGNYYKGESLVFTGRVANFDRSNGGKQLTFGQWQENATKLDSTDYLLTTGSSEHNKVYNIYDIAGNLWEWTDESSTDYNDATKLPSNRVLRGGSYMDYSHISANYRCCNNSASLRLSQLGFRVVLYIV